MTDDHAVAGVIEEEEDDFLFSDDDEIIPARRGIEPERVRRWPRIVAIIVGVTLIVVGALAGYYAITLNGALGGIKRNQKMLPSTRPSAIEPNTDGRPLTFVLMGTDASDGGTPRSDSLMVAYLPANRKNLYLVSFTRDMWVNIPGHGKGKINSAYSYGGSALTVQTLETMLNVRMDHAASIDFDGFIHLTTVLGGVTVYNEHASSTAGFTYPKGMITIKGAEALVYVRERKNLPNGDLDRAKRQRDVVTAIIKKATSPGVIANPFKLNEFVTEVAKVVQVDEGLTNGVVYKTARELKFGDDSIRSLQAPIKGFGTTPNGQSINIVDEQGMKNLAEAMRTDQMESYYQVNKK